MSTFSGATQHQSVEITSSPPRIDPHLRWTAGRVAALMITVPWSPNIEGLTPQPFVALPSERWLGSVYSLCSTNGFAPYRLSGLLVIRSSSPSTLCFTLAVVFVGGTHGDDGSASDPRSQDSIVRF